MHYTMNTLSAECHELTGYMMLVTYFLCKYYFCCAAYMYICIISLGTGLKLVVLVSVLVSKGVVLVLTFWSRLH